MALHLCYNSPQSKLWDCLVSEEEIHPVDLSSLSNKLLPGLTALGFKDDRRHKGAYSGVWMTWMSHGPLYFLISVKQ